MWFVPRTDLEDAKVKKDLSVPAFYILVGGEGAKKAYIGQTEDFAQRIKNHDSRKAFWDYALAFVKSSGSLTTTDTRYLEYKGIKQAKDVGVYELDENKQNPGKPVIPEYQQDPMDDFFKDCLYLVSFIGLELFEKHHTRKPHNNKTLISENRFYIKTKTCACGAVYDPNSGKITVLAESIICDMSAIKLSTKKAAKRQALVDAYAKNISGKTILTSDITFDSPSGASLFCLGYSSDGWNYWKDENNRTLDEIYRKGT